MWRTLSSMEKESDNIINKGFTDKAKLEVQKNNKKF